MRVFRRNCVIFIFKFFVGYTGLLCEVNINECETIKGICGRGICIDTLGKYRCECNDTTKCGFNCAWDNPCFYNPCVNGRCESQCSDKPDYICHCPDEFDGKNCTEVAVSFLTKTKRNVFNTWII